MLTVTQRASLNNLCNTAEFGTLPKKTFIERAKANSWTVKAEQLTGYQDGTYNRRKFNRMDYPEQKAYEERLSKLKTKYYLYAPTGRDLYEITKAEYEYYNILPAPASAEIPPAEAEDYEFMKRSGQGIVVDCPEDEARAQYPTLFDRDLVQYWCAGFSSPAVIRLRAN